MNALSLATMLVTIVIWSSAYAGIRVGLTHFHPGHLALYRFLVASAALMAYAASVRMRPPNRGDVLRIFALSVLGISGYHLALNYGEQSVPAGTASFIVAGAPVMMALLGAALYGERMAPLGWLGTGAGLGGVLLIILGRGDGISFTRGALLVVLATACASVYNVFQRDLVARVGPMRFTVYSLTLGTVPMLAFLPGFATAWRTAPLATHIAVIYIGLFPAALAYLGWTFVLARMGSARAGSFLYVTPVFAVAVGWLWLGEIPSPVSMFGGVVALAGVVLVTRCGNAPRGGSRDYPTALSQGSRWRPGSDHEGNEQGVHLGDQETNPRTSRSLARPDCC